MSKSIEFKNITMEFLLEDRTIKVFDDFSLTIDPSEFTVLIGKSGCGKTTLLRLLAGLIKPTKGEIVIPEGLNIGMVFQEDRLMPWLTVEKNILLGMDKKETRVGNIIKLVGLEGFEKAYPNQLSGGMRQRCALARTLIRKSNLILMDEPFGALDAFTRKNMQDQLIKIRQETGCGVIFVTHDINEATLLGDRVITIRQGSKAREGIIL